ncbi:MAG: hypothetical protein COU69_04430 [Candidatus Pacebacteria bacterium CG10_big_fil_rev_8_21_14_0_10_56_10]|nr:MAG: hypothetical protein COU69_04430 [Candidatus Pacebacteria bacterium CG10_big_fil_rev_8_21_14_0_10_56_10]
MSKKSLKTIKKVYERGENIIQHLKQNKGNHNTLEMITISYDLQSGTYIREVKKNPRFNREYTAAIARVIDELGVKYDLLLEAGVGEATTLANVVLKLRDKPKKVFGFDLSWSRTRYAIEYLTSKHINNSFLFTGNLFNIPLADDSIDIVYTSHTIEPNSGREKEALRELMRVTKKYLVLLEPAHEFANEEARKRMESHGYIKNLYGSAVDLGMDVIEHRLFDHSNNHLNPTGLIVIKKDLKTHRTVRNPLVCPVTRTPLRLIKGSYFSSDSLLAYPVIKGVPCLLDENAVIATHYKRWK